MTRTLLKPGDYQVTGVISRPSQNSVVRYMFGDFSHTVFAPNLRGHGTGKLLVFSSSPKTFTKCHRTHAALICVLPLKCIWWLHLKHTHPYFFWGGAHWSRKHWECFNLLAFCGPVFVEWAWCLGLLALHCPASASNMRALKQARTKELRAEAESTANKAWDPLGVDWKTGFVNMIFSLPTFYTSLYVFTSLLQATQIGKKWANGKANTVLTVLLLGL